MIWAVLPGTVGFGHGSAAVAALVLELWLEPVPPKPAPPEVAVAVGVLGVDAHWLGDWVGPLKLGSAVVLGPAAPFVLAPRLDPLPDDIAPPPVPALALVGPASAN